MLVEDDPNQRSVSRPLRVAVVNSYFPPHTHGGAEFIAGDLASGLHGLGMSVKVLTINDNSAGSTKDLWRGIEVTRILAPNLWPPHQRTSSSKSAGLCWKLIDIFNPIAFFHTRRFLRSEPFDVLLTHNLAGLSASVWSAAHAESKPVVHVLHDFYLLCPNINMLSGFSSCATPCAGCRLLRLPHSGLSSKVAGVVGVSSFILERHLELGLFRGVANRCVINNQRAIVSVHRPTRGSARVFGYLGGVTPAKGLDLLLSAFKRFTLHHQDTRLLVAGNGNENYIRKLHALVGNSNIEFMGHVDAAAFLNSIDVLVVPSIWDEPFGLVCVEALSIGIPVIGSNRGGIPEVVRDQFNGLLFDPLDECSLLDALVRLYDSPANYQRLASNARSSVASFTSPTKMYASYMNLLKAVSTRT